MAKGHSSKGSAAALKSNFTSGKKVSVPIGQARSISSGPKPFKTTRDKLAPKGC